MPKMYKLFVALVENEKETRVILRTKYWVVGFIALTDEQLYAQV
jgi:predicted GH43/DUF377 family glycosyl hydrolase